MALVNAAVRLIALWMTSILVSASLFLSPANAADPEQVSIQKLLSPQVTSYQQHLVTLEGVISQLQVLPPAIGVKKCPVLYGRATFVLEDETDSLLVEVLGGCKPGAVEVLPKDGDRVRITALVHVLRSDAPRDVIAQATSIQILESY